MIGFKEWLENQKGEIEQAAVFADQIAELGISWPEKNDKDALEAAIKGSDLGEPEKKAMLTQMESLWVKYEEMESAPSPGNLPINGLKRLISKATPSVFACLVLVILFIILLFYAFFGKNEFLKNLSSVEFARGLITFLFALGTIGIAWILIFSIFTSELSASESKERFYRGKEILTILIGILGTIVGFYFGSPTNGETKPSIAMELSDISFSSTSPAMEEPWSLCALVSGGKRPYTYSMVIMEGTTTIEKIEEQDSENGLIFISFVMKKTTNNYKVKPVLLVKDASGQSIKHISEEIEIKKKLPL